MPLDPDPVPEVTGRRMVANITKDKVRDSVFLFAKRYDR